MDCRWVCECGKGFWGSSKDLNPCCPQCENEAFYQKIKNPNYVLTPDDEKRIRYEMEIERTGGMEWA